MSTAVIITAIICITVVAVWYLFVRAATKEMEFEYQLKRDEMVHKWDQLERDREERQLRR